MGTSATLQFVASGFLVVLLALSLLWAVSVLIGRAFARRDATPTQARPAPDAPAGRPIPAGHVAAIAAAVAALTDGRGRVVTIRAPVPLAGAWTNEGRGDQAASHRVRWDWAVPGPPHVEHPITKATGGSQPERNKGGA